LHETVLNNLQKWFFIKKQVSLPDDIWKIVQKYLSKNIPLP